MIMATHQMDFAPFPGNGNSVHGGGAHHRAGQSCRAAGPGREHPYSGLLRPAPRLGKAAQPGIGGRVLDFIDVAFLTDRVIPSLNMGLEVSLKLIIPATSHRRCARRLHGRGARLRPALARRLADAIVAVIRGVPLTVQLMILYFGLPNIPYLRIDFEPFTLRWWASFSARALSVGIVRGALLSIRQGQIRAGQASA